MLMNFIVDCQLVVAKLESLLNDTQNEEAIIQKLDKVCTYVPPEQQALVRIKRDFIALQLTDDCSVQRSLTNTFQR